MDPAAVVAAFRQQAEACRESSLLYAALMERAADDVAAGGPVARLLEGWEGHPVLDALSMRLLGAVHVEVLAGRAPELAAHYPSAGGVADGGAAWPAFVALVEERRELLRGRLVTQVQTNEVRRCAALLGGFLTLAEETGLPLRLLELGSSAGLNLLWDRYRYELGPHRWGDPAAKLCLRADWEGPPPPLEAPLRVASREGCDRAPVDLTDPEQRLRLEGFVWPDQPDRLALLRGAIAVARLEPPRVIRARARDWVGAALGTPVPGCVTALFQSVMWWYLPAEERDAVTAQVEAAGLRASAEAPLAWLRMEGSRPEHTEIRLRTWPGGQDRQLALAQWHGRWVKWLPAEGAGRQPTSRQQPTTP